MDTGLTDLPRRFSNQLDRPVRFFTGIEGDIAARLAMLQARYGLQKLLLAVAGDAGDTEDLSSERVKG